MRARCLGHNQSWNLTKEERRRRRCGELLFMIITHIDACQLIIHYPYAVDIALSSTCVTCDEKTFFFFFFSYKQNPHVQYILMASTRCTSTNKNLANQQPDLCVLLLLLRLTKGLPKRPSPIVEFQLSLWPLSNAHHVTTD